MKVIIPAVEFGLHIKGLDLPIYMTLIITILWARILVQVTIYRRLLMVEMVISTNQKPTIYRNLYENTAPGAWFCFETDKDIYNMSQLSVGYSWRLSQQ